MSEPSNNSSTSTRLKDLAVQPCNFRSAGRLSNESGRTLSTLHEMLARNLANSLDVYLGIGLEVRLVDLQQLTMEDYRALSGTSGYIMPCATTPVETSALLEMDNALMFTVIDLLLGGTGGKAGEVRELTEIDEEILEDVGGIIARQIDKLWQPIGIQVAAQKCVKPNLAYRLFPPTEKVHRIKFEISVAGITGVLHLALPASLSSHIVRNVRADQLGTKRGAPFARRQSLAERMLSCEYLVSGELPDLSVSVRDLSRIEVGTVLTLSAPVSGPGWLKLEGQPYFDALPVGQGSNKAMQLVRPLHVNEESNKPTGENKNANA